jgi:hypothetical protein
MKPFLLHLVSDVKSSNLPPSVYDEDLSVNMYFNQGRLVAMSEALFATQTKTAAAPESDDDDPTDSVRDPGLADELEQTILATLTKTEAKAESDDND